MKRLFSIVVLAAMLLALSCVPATATASGPMALAGQQGGYWDSHGIGPSGFTLAGSWNGEPVGHASYWCDGAWTDYIRGEYEGRISCVSDSSIARGGAPATWSADVTFAADDVGGYGMSGYLSDGNYFDCEGASYPDVLSGGQLINGACVFHPPV